MGKRRISVDKNYEMIVKATRLLLCGLGEDVSREGLKDTPARVARMWVGFNGMEKPLMRTFCCDKYDEMVVVKDLPFYSFCEHHLLPFFGTAKIGYLPDRKVLGLSKVARILNYYALRPQIQEGLTMSVAEDMMKTLKPKGVGVVLEAEHLCMSLRGVQKPGHKTVTSCLLGKFKEDKVRGEFLRL